MNSVNKPVRTFPWKDNIAYSTGNMGVGIMNGMASLYLLFFYTDVLGISAAAIGIIFLSTRLWDAINDPIMGIIVDRTNTRWGKFRPFILFGTFPLAVLFILTYYTPDFSHNGKVMWAFATCLSGGMMLTLINIPYHAQAATLTSDSNERAEIGALVWIFLLMSFLIVGAITLPLVKTFSTPQKGFLYVTAIFSIPLIISLYIPFFSTKKYDHPGSNIKPVKNVARRFQLKKTIAVITKNRPLLALISSNLFVQMQGTMFTSAIVYFFKYNLNIEEFYPTFTGLFFIFTIFGSVSTPLMVKKFGKKTVFQLNNAIIAILCLICFFFLLNIDRETAASSFHFGPFFFMTMLIGFCAGTAFAVIWGAIPDSVEYAEWKTGIRSEGLIYSLLAFGTKTGMALGGALSAAILAYVNYIPNIEQTDRTLFGILFLFLGSPCILRILAGISMHYYNLNEEKFAQIVIELDKQKKVKPQLS